MVKVKVTTDLEPMKKQLISGAQKARQRVANQIHMDSNRYAPMLTGDMRNQSTVNVDGRSITWHAFYSIYQYSKQYSNYSTPGTGSKWDEVAASKHMAAWEEVAKRAFNL